MTFIFLSSTSSTSSSTTSLFSSKRSLTIGAAFVLLITLTASEVQIDLDCQPGWTLQGHECYKLFTDPFTWTAAERLCMSYGGTQATPFDYYANEDVGKFVSDQGVEEYWLGFIGSIGANRIDSPPNDNRVLQYSGGIEAQLWVGHWYINHPKLVEGNCVSVIKDKRELHKWKLGPCMNKLPFLCQRPVCSKGAFHCVNGNCVNPILKCDGYDDCGDRSDEIDCPTNCNRHIRFSVQGTIVYPSGGGNYPNNADCLWLLEADIGYNVQLTITRLSLEADSDELLLLEGGLTEVGSRELDRLTGSGASLPAYYYSSNNLMIVKFRSDGTGTNTGFTFSYQQVKSSLMPVENRLIATNDPKDQEFPYYNNYVLGNQDFVYIIEAEDEQQIVSVEILDIDLPEDAVVMLIDGETVNDQQLASLRGTYDGNGHIFSHGRFMYIALHTVQGGRNKGLKIRYKQGCGAVIQRSSGYINSPGFPAAPYPNSVTCNWRVEVPGNADINMIFERWNLDPTDTLTIRDLSGGSLGSFSGSNVPSPLRVTGGGFTAQLVSSTTRNQEGFNITYSVDCPPPNLNYNDSSISPPVSLVYGSAFTVTCKSGSRFTQAEHKDKTSVTMVCEANGKWNVNTSPRCERILCPRAPGLDNGYVVSSAGNLAYLGTVKYQCYQGFTLSGPETITCGINGQWSMMPTCSVSKCPASPPAPANGVKTITAGDGESYGSIVRYSCNEGYDLIGEPTMFCESSGNWNGSVPTCRILTCFMRDIPNGALSANQVSIGQQITLTCDSGYTTSQMGVTSMTCNNDRTLTPQLTCQNVNECANSPCEGSCVDTEGSYICQCGPGFQVSGNTCADINECASNPCDGGCTNQPGSYTCSCPTGFTLYISNGTEGFVIPPGEDGTLAGDKYRLDHSCVPMKCPSPADIPNTELLTEMTNYYYQDKVMYKCKLGYILANPAAGTLTCDENRSWVGPAISCIVATCAVDPPPTDLENMGTITPAGVTTLNYGEELTISCNVPGFQPTTFTRKRVCTLIGVNYMLDGSEMDYECGFISCGSPMDVPGSEYTGLSTFNFGDSFMFGCKAMFVKEGQSTDGNDVVTCKDNGQWNFGTLNCIGKQCEDPGQPLRGEQVQSDYRNGQLVTFNCTQPGYELDPLYPITCLLAANGTAHFNDSLPTCVDVQKPVITNCPAADIVIPKYASVGKNINPLSYLDNGAIKGLTVTPAWPPTEYYILTATAPETFVYTFTDFGDNQATCTIRVRGRDNVPPSIRCPSPFIYTFRTGMEDIRMEINRTLVTVSDDITPEDDLIVTFVADSYTFNPNQLEQSFPPTHYPIIAATVEDAAGNTATCNLRLFYEPDVCSPYHLREPPNSVKTCAVSGAGGNGYTCTITCNPGYILYSDLTQTSATVSCSGPGDSFSPSTEFKCIKLDETFRGRYRIEYNYTYEGVNISNGCKSDYVDVVNKTFQKLSDDKKIILDEFCDNGIVLVTGKVKLGQLIVNEAAQKILITVVVEFDKREGANYAFCAGSVNLILGDPLASNANFTTFKPLKCESFRMTTDMNKLFEGYYCDSNQLPISSPSDPNAVNQYCLECPVGTYTATDGSCIPCPVGTFNNKTGMTSCAECSGETSTYMEGAFSDECAAMCPSGSISLDGLPPCNFCPDNMYWVNATYCAQCPPGTITRTDGANNIDECKAICPPGQFNEIDGHADCMSCPKHHYATASGSMKCEECPRGTYTVNNGSSSSTDCRDLSTSTECSSKCKFGDCQTIFRHVQSCVCKEGYHGEYCDISFDLCESNPCYHGGICTYLGDLRYTCDCPTGTAGDNCETLIKTCDSSSCVNNGMCENLLNDNECHCLPGFTGDRCEIVQDQCQPNMCENGGVCTPQGTIRYSCSCPPAYTGMNCEKSKDDCYANPCRNNGTCQDGFQTYTCDCDAAHENLNCNQRKTYCNGTETCGTGGRCVEDEPTNSYICVCDEYSELDGATRKCVPKKFCLSNPCVSPALCYDRPTSFECVCPVGYEGSMCQHNIDDCKSNPCQHGGICTDGILQATCNCTDTGYSGSNCEIEINECDPNPCISIHTDTCQNMVNDYQCVCRPGYSGKRCEFDIDECLPEPCLHDALCAEFENRYECGCPPGWTGQNCETEMMQCLPAPGPCQNGAQCYETFNDYFCQCKPNTFGTNCENTEDICTDVNPCVHGSCLNVGGDAECTCLEGYEGDRCDMQIHFCADNATVCQNDGQCIPELDDYECNCEPGYAEKDCSVNIDDCLTKSCPTSAECIDMEQEAYCRCPLDFEGPNCDKTWDQNFDFLFDHEDRTGMAYLPYPIPLDSKAFSVALWIQFGEKGGTGTFLSLMTVPKDNSLQNKSPLLVINDLGVYYYEDDGSVKSIMHNIDYNDDGKWHYLVVNVNKETGQMNFIVDTINSPPVMIMTGTFDVNLWLMLGSKYDTALDMPVKGEGFYGKLSKVTVYSRVLKHTDEVTVQGNTDVTVVFPDSILRWSSELKYTTGVIRMTPSMADNSCPFGYTNYPTCGTLLPGKNKITISGGKCPEDILEYSTSRVTSVSWEEPTFSGQASVISSVTSGDYFVWGKYQVVIEASNADGNKALCLFNIFVQNDQCTVPATPPNADELLCPPDLYEEYRQCGLTCKANYAPSIPSPLLHTCGPVGNWDPEERFLPYRITPCGNTSQPVRQLIITLRYTVPTMECEAVKTTFMEELRKVQVKLNGEWNRVCTKPDCSDTEIVVECVNSRRRKRQTPRSTLNVEAVLTLPDILDTVTLRSDGVTTKKTEDLYRDLILAASPDNPFDFSALVSDAFPVSHTFDNEPDCIAPKVLNDNLCVNCGPGTFYNATADECQFCPIGSFQPFESQYNCTPCPGSDTTQTVGSVTASECHESCPAGQYFDTAATPQACTNCSRGYYQPQSGQFYCLACPADKTTKYPGTVLESDCSSDCPPGQEIGTADSCTPCQIGYYRGPDDPVCLRCPTGRVTQSNGSLSIDDCNVADNPPGTYRNKDNPLNFTHCEIGSYQPLKWQYSCIACKDGYLTETVGETSADKCKFTCPAGQQKVDTVDECEDCPVGFYNDGSDPFGRCTPCDPEYLTPQQGSISKDNCTLYRCGIGEQPKPDGSVGCDPCPQGSYQDEQNKDQCKLCSPGTSTPGMGSNSSTDCQTFCPSGSEKLADGTCKPCEIGFYKDNTVNVFSPCTPCDNSDYVTPSTGSTSNDNCTVLNCLEGYKQNLATEECEPCPRGTYQDQKYQDDCIPCDTDEFTRYPNSTKKEDCETYCESGYEKLENGTCEACERGYYKDNSIDVFMPCTMCDPEFVTPAGPPATSEGDCKVRNCSAGSFIDGNTCTLCPQGSYQDQPWQTNCTTCPPDKNTVGEGADSITMCLLNCSAGFESKEGENCTMCDMGYYKEVAGTTPCEPCDDFNKNDIQITPNPGATNENQCTKLVCLPGYYPLSGKCTRCGYGTYQPDRWEDVCLSCPAGETTYMQGATQESACEPECQKGEGLVSGACEQCEIGFYNDKSDPARRECFKCTPGFITAAEGSTTKDDCEIRDCSTLGQYRDPVTNDCKNCALGYYQDEPRQDSCKVCPAGTTTQFEGSASSGDCKKDCDAGSQLNNVTNQCEPCPLGTYRSKLPGENQWYCVKCGTDLTTAAVGSDDKSDCNKPTCAPGLGYNNSTLKCESCPKNTYQNEGGKYLPCKSCPDNTLTENVGTATVDGCVAPCDAQASNPCDLEKVCVNVGTGIRCDCKPAYITQGTNCIHKCDLPEPYCGRKGQCVRDPFECVCSDGYTGERCTIRPDAQSQSDNETETIIIAVVTTVCGLLFLIALVVCICVMARRRPVNGKTSNTSEFDERASLATRSMKGMDDYPTFAVNPAFSSKPPSVFGAPSNGSLAPQPMKMYDNAVYQPDSDPAVYQA